jgi:glycogen synthase
MTVKLLLYTSDWFPLMGGIQTVTMALAKGLSEVPAAESGVPVEVTLVTATPANGMDDSALQFRVVRRPSLGQLIREIRSADVVHLAGAALLPLGLSLLFRKPVVIEHHGYQVICPNGLLLFGSEHSHCPGHFMAGNYGKCIECNTHSMGRWGSARSLLLTFVRRWLARRANVHVAPSRHMGKRIALPRTQLIFHGVAPIELRISPANGSTNHRLDCYAFVGRLVREKGAEVLLRAAHQLSRNGFEFRLKIVGDGPERAPLEKLAAELGLKEQTEFLGWVPAETVTNVLTEASAVLMPSLWEDCAPLVAIEQMMQGRLVIASDIGGLGELVQGHGLTFLAGNVEALERCMRSAIESRDSLAQLRHSAQQHALVAYQVKRMVEEHRSLYRTLADVRSGKYGGDS